MSAIAQDAASEAGFVRGAPATILRLEGLVVLAGAVLAYQHLAASWWMFAVLFLTPDLMMLGYLAGPRIGAVCYNLAHSYLGPALLAAASLWRGEGLGLQLSLIWAAHVGFDRMLGYGMKYGTGFGHTHLGLKGKAAQAAEKPLPA